MTSPTRTPPPRSPADDRQEAAAPAAGAAHRERRLRIPYAVWVKTTTALAIIAAWEAFIRLFAPDYVARPSGIVVVLPEVLFLDDSFHAALLGTLLPIAQGMVIAVVLGVLVGLAMGQVKWIEHGFKLYTYGLFALPMVAVVPLVTMWLGYSDGARLAIIVFAGFFPMALNVYDGARSVPHEYMEVARSFRSHRWAVWFGVVLPASLPYLLAGFRLAAGRVLVAAVVAEYLISIDGLGFYIQLNARSFKHSEAFVAVIVLALLGVGSLLLVRWLTRRYCPWYRPSGAG